MQMGATEDTLPGCTADSASSRITVFYEGREGVAVYSTSTVTSTRRERYSAFGSRIGPMINISDSDEADLSVGSALFCSFPTRIGSMKGATVFRKVVRIVVSGPNNAQSSSRKDRRVRGLVRLDGLKGSR